MALLLVGSAHATKTHPASLRYKISDFFSSLLDTAATKSGIVAANQKLEGRKIAIVGVGGTGSYVLDFISKTPIAEIHVFDRDVFLNHNAFRCPGAPSLEDLKKVQKKVNYVADVYSRMRKKIIPHDYFIDEETVEQLREMSFVFICVDKGTGKRFMSNGCKSGR
jgi:tRNA A37 threonylcarbamoyladenosine dehydratase